jgi:hypothetical protein
MLIYEVKPPTIRTGGKAEVERAREEKSTRGKIREKRKGEKKEDAGLRKGSKVAKPEGRKVGSLKRRVRSHLAR